MKRMLLLLLACLLMCGCSAQPDDETLPSETIPAETYVEPEGFYDPDSQLEAETDGAVKVYPLDIAGVYSFACMGEEILIFSGAETLTRLTGETLYAASSIQIPMHLYPKNDTVLITDKGISYFDSVAMETVILDNTLKEINRIAAPEDLSGFPILSPDRKTLYYATSDSVRALDLSTGISKLLKQSTHSTQSITAVLMNGTVLEFNTYDKDGTFQTFYISAETGETLYASDDLLSLTAPADRYYAMLDSGAVQTLVWGAANEEPQSLTPAEPNADYWVLDNQNAVVTVAQDSETGSNTLYYYDLDTGLCVSSLTLTGGSHFWGIDDTLSGDVFVMTYDAGSGGAVLYRWDPEQLPTGDTAVYTGPHYTPENPDTEGLAQCQAKADAIGEKYGIRILVGFDAAQVQPWDYSLEVEHLTDVIEKELQNLDAVLSAYPTDFLRTLATSGNSSLTISLVRQLTGTPESGSLETANGIQFWNGTDAYVAVAAGTASEQTIYHELFHVIESRIMSECSAYDNWSTLNPKGFEYDYDYTANLERDGSDYLQDDSRAFIDSYSMSYPKEDRARIMEYAMMPDNAHLFQSKTMQNKLRQLCLGIREAFQLKKSPEVFLWEQYLSVPLAYTE